jgi:hypothetical protein
MRRSRAGARRAAGARQAATGKTRRRRRPEGDAPGRSARRRHRILSSPPAWSGRRKRRWATSWWSRARLPNGMISTRTSSRSSPVRSPPIARPDRTGGAIHDAGAPIVRCAANRCPRPRRRARLKRVDHHRDIYGHTSDDAARAAVEGLAGQLGLLDSAAVAVAIRVAIHTPTGYEKWRPTISPKPSLICCFSGRADRI